MTDPKPGRRPDVTQTDARDTGKPERYFLTPEDFDPENAPQSKDDIVLYREGDRITRQSFISFITESFRVSRGSPTDQHLFFLWVELHYGFDCVRAFSNFLNQGGWNNSLSEEERKFFLRNMMAVNTSAHGDIVTNVTNRKTKRMPKSKEIFYGRIGKEIELELKSLSGFIPRCLHRKSEN